MRTRSLLIAGSLILAGCISPSQYSWQDARAPARQDANQDLQYCKEYTARQYKAGTPTGEPFLSKEQKDRLINEERPLDEWRTDRTPFKTTSINQMPIHDVPTDYTGYPAELDYYPDYKNDIFEKCMSDRGWEYLPQPSD
jgi:hypothetical protein